MSAEKLTVIAKVIGPFLPALLGLSLNDLNSVGLVQYQTSTGGQ